MGLDENPADLHLQEQHRDSIVVSSGKNPPNPATSDFHFKEQPEVVSLEKKPPSDLHNGRWAGAGEGRGRVTANTE